MTVTFFSIFCLICLSFLTGFFTCLYIISQLNLSEDVDCKFEPEIKIGYKRNSVK